MNAVEPVRPQQPPNADSDAFDASAAAELLFVRAIDPRTGRPSIFKRVLPPRAAPHSTGLPLVPDGFSQLQHEFDVLTRLTGIKGVPRVIRLDPVDRELVMLDPGGVDLATAGLAATLEWPAYLDLAAALARLLGAVHSHGVVHRRIGPHTLWIEPAALQPSIVGFDHAVLVDGPTSVTQPPQDAGRVGTDLAFISPEQTGRMNRPVDHRSDLYSLGVVLYELATGRLPFEPSDPLSMRHAHLARTPIEPHQVRPAVPHLLSAVLMRLLNKEPDGRYQRAESLARDLTLLAQGRLIESQIGRDEAQAPPQRPTRLHGMAAHSTFLREMCEQAARGGPHLLLISGPPGVGKSALALQAAQHMAQANGLFISGRFSQFQHHLPFSAPLQALDELCGLLLAGDKSSLARWKARLQTALKTDGGVLTRLSPALAALMGSQPPVPTLTPLDSQARLLGALQALLREVASAQQPLVLFLDDLQWADLASLAFMQSLLLQDDLKWLLLIGAWRSDVVPPEHPLQRMVDHLCMRSSAVRQLTLGPLSRPDFAGLVADTLSRPVAQVQELASRLHAQTEGNPHHAIELVQALHAEGALPGAAAQPQLDASDLATAPDRKLPELLVRRLCGLDPRVQSLLSLAATLGFEFTLGMLRLVADMADARLQDGLRQLVDAGVLATPRLAPDQPADAHTVYQFCHHHMQQAAYGLAERAVRRAMHLHCARRLDASGQPDVRLAVASHYAEVAALLDVAAPRERAIAAHHFDHAAALARGTGNIESAAHFLTLARQLRPPDAWQREPAHTFSLDVSWHAVLCSLGRHAEADTVYAELVRRAGDPLQLVDPTCMQAQSLSSRQQYEASVQLGIALLGRLGIEVPAQAVAHAEAQLELDHFEVLARELPLERLVNAPHATAAVSATARLMSHLSVAAFFFHPETAFWLVLRCCRLWAERGFCEDMITPLAGTMLATIGLRDDYRTGWRAVQVAIETARQRAVGPAARRVYKVHGLIACHWFEPLEQAIPHARVAYDQLMKSGDFETACHACFISQTASLEVASHLDLAEKEIDAALQLAARTSNGHAADSFSSLRQFTRALRGDTDHFGSFCDAEFDETQHIEATRGNPTGAAVFRIYRAWSACLFFDTEALAVHVAAALPLKGHVTGFYPTVLLRVATCLSTLDRMAAWPAATRQGDPAFASLSETLTHHLGWLERRAADMPANFAHLLDWVEARRAACEQRHWDAACRFDVAMRRSGAAGRTLHHAMIVEQAGRFHLQGGLPSTGEHLLRKALAIYRRWGARGKALQLEQRFAFLGPTAPAAASTLRSSRSSPADIDRLAILRASQALSSETDLDRLVSQIVEVIAQLSGATGVCLLFRDDRTAGWAIVGGVRDGVPLPGLPQPTDAAAQLGLASSVVRYALRTLETEVIDDVCHDERFMHDPALAGARACSMLLMPVLSKGVVQAVLLLENRLALRFFTAEHLELLRVITSQLSISIENALLYRSLERRVADRTEALQRAAGQLMLRERALASSANGVIITDMTRPGMPIIYVNAMFEQITGYTADEALGRSASFLEGDDTDQPDARVLHDAIAAHRSCKVLLRNYRKDGSMFWNELSVAPVRDVDGLVTHFVDIQVDVTERIAAQESGRLRTERLNAVFDLSPDGFVLLDSEERVSIVNPAFERMTGLLAGDLLGLDRHAFEARLKELCGGIEAEVAVPPQFAETQPPAMWEGFDPTLPEAPSAGLARQGLLHLLKPQPRALLRRVRRGPVHVDERAGREGDRRSSARGPETVMYFRDMTRELEIDQMKSDFLSTAAHELRTPMTSIFGFTELLIRRRLSDAQREDLLGTIHRQAGTLINLINELLDLARIEARRGKDFRPKLQPLQPLVRGMLAGLMIQDDPRTVQVVMRTGPAWVNVDADKLSLALTNVVSNAYKYSVAGDITLTLVDRTREGRAEVGVRVTDQGIGMTAQQLSRLFERFFRADTSGRIPGTGLGTTIVKEVVELHGGQVEVDSKPGVGTAFTVWLPLHAAPSTEALTAMPVSPDLLRLDFGNAPSSRTR